MPGQKHSRSCVPPLPRVRGLLDAGRKALSPKSVAPATQAETLRAYLLLGIEGCECESIAGSILGRAAILNTLSCFLKVIFNSCRHSNVRDARGSER